MTALFLYIICVLAANAQVLSEKLYKENTVSFADGAPFALSQIKNNKATVFITMLPGCPICQKQAYTLNELVLKYKDHRISFLGIWYPGVDSLEMRKYIKEQNLLFPILTDEACGITVLLESEIAPDVVVVDANLKVLYRGKIDNWFEAVGKRKPKPTEFFLDNALNAIVEGKKVPVEYTKPVGCIIECARRIKVGQSLPGR
jgi:peroxiredoxin